MRETPKYGLVVDSILSILYVFKLLVMAGAVGVPYSHAGSGLPRNDIVTLPCYNLPRPHIPELVKGLGFLADGECRVGAYVRQAGPGRGVPWREWTKSQPRHRATSNTRPTFYGCGASGHTGHGRRRCRMRPQVSAIYLAASTNLQRSCRPSPPTLVRQRTGSPNPSLFLDHTAGHWGEPSPDFSSDCGCLTVLSARLACPGFSARQ